MTGERWTIPGELPTGAAFTKAFAPCKENGQRGPKHVVLFAQLIAKMSVEDIKFDSAMLHYLTLEKAYVKVNMFELRNVGSPGFLIEVHPNLVRKDGIKRNITEALGKVDDSSNGHFDGIARGE